VCKKSRLLFVVGLILPAIGCSKSFHKVEGTVTMDGQPVVGATVMLMPTGEGGQPGSGITDSSGKFKIINPTNDKGIAKGEYKIVITKAEAEGDSKAPDVNDPTKAFGDLMKGKMDTRKGKPTGPLVTKHKQLLNARYAKPETTPFTVNVPAEGDLNLKLEK
jgi:hypothetical protein